ncbi:MULTISPECIES: hypothetical protein [Pseudoalteromonas]|uniref:Uncharacterized protein n=1 Tax=Pseudoalteromonas luteoviolacea (strain 2ta16) TaxID=1353533 RepID=V4H4X8_PSEL2|nr:MULTISPECIES: hypothetical protein [Pseudoalteromonas]ESP92541.1 hypothetical protein PL2TA16_04134 [Pseudoalteromonas luteoviolacea 2ta16]KZN32739.1 hypothetical protein N483_26930 [Pseudoalteromonas luteoviolacea NCIMB 1944]MCG7550564.1 hypothetical protein [Pseudoalteromonas sp. Of7M-16]
MKLKLLAALTTGFLATSAFAQTSVQDIDGYNRTTTYANGAVDRIVTDSLSARTFEAWVYYKEAGSECTSGYIFDELTGQQYGTVNIGTGGIGATMVDTVHFNNGFTDEQLKRNRVLALNCQNLEGEQFKVYHKFSALPVITWDTNLAGVGEYKRPDCTGASSHCGGRGWYEQVSYTSSLHIDNKNKDTYCSSTMNDGFESRVFNGYDSTPLFHTNHYALENAVYNYSGPAFRQTVTCHSPVGEVQRTQVWVVSGENDINLEVDYTVYK